MGAGQTPVQSFWQKLLGMIKAGTPSFACCLLPLPLPCGTLTVEMPSRCCECTASSNRADTHCTASRLTFCLPVPSKPAPRVHALQQEGKLRPQAVISHILPLKEADKGYDVFNAKRAHPACPAFHPLHSIMRMLCI